MTLRLLLTIFLLYLAGALTGAVFMLPPSASTLLMDPFYKNLSTAHYGILNLLVGVGTVSICGLSGMLVTRIGLKGIFFIGITSSTLAMLLFGLAHHIEWDIPAITLSVLLIGIGFGATSVSSNVILFELFPKHFSPAIVAFWASVGLGTTLSPILFHSYHNYDQWWHYPEILFAILFVTAIVLFYLMDMWWIRPKEEKKKIEPKTPLLHLISVIFLFGILFALMTSWGIPYLQIKQISTTYASWALGAFWGGITIGRLVAASLTLAMPARYLYLAFPLFLIGAMLLFGFITEDLYSLIVFFLVGFGSSTNFPLTFKFGEEIYPQIATRISALLMIFYMVGYGLGAYFIGLSMESLPLEEIFAWSFLLPALVLVFCFALVRYLPKKIWK